MTEDDKLGADVDPTEVPAPARACAYETTRTSPFGKYATCRCGWVSPDYSETHEEAYRGWEAHRAEVRAAEAPAEPTRMGARVRDRDGQTWRRGRRIWTCEAKVGTSYFDRKAGRWATVERVGRLPWHALVSMYGPVEHLDNPHG